jgi:aminoglycoside phosphotransferase family enzyme
MPAAAVQRNIRPAAAYQGVCALNKSNNETSLNEKVAFLSRAAGGPDGAAARRETHMSWVFLAGDTVFKLKKPVRFPYLDFSTLARREAACRAELALNRRLAPDVYRAVAPVVRTRSGLAIGRPVTEPGGRPADDPDGIVDWLVVMRRLDPGGTLEHAMATHRLAAGQLDRLLAALAAFYRRAPVVLLTPQAHLIGLRRSLAYDMRVLVDSRLGPPTGRVRQIGAVQRRFLDTQQALIAGRVRARRIVDGHGDLRPEHIWLGPPVRIIDGLEFNPGLRAVDPFDEIAFLCVECERLGCTWAAEHIRRRARRLLPGAPPEALFTFYRCRRAMVRARLAAARLIDPGPHPPDKWRRQAGAYLRLAAADARRLHQFMATGSPSSTR